MPCSVISSASSATSADLSAATGGFCFSFTVIANSVLTSPALTETTALPFATAVTVAVPPSTETVAVSGEEDSAVKPYSVPSTEMYSVKSMLRLSPSVMTKAMPSFSFSGCFAASFLHAPNSATAKHTIADKTAQVNFFMFFPFKFLFY